MLLKSFYELEFNAAILDEFLLSKSFADLKILSVYALRGAALAPDFRLLNFDF